MNVSVVIPARWESTRLPGKVLLDIGGQAMLQRVWECARAMQSASEIWIATDSPRVAEAAQGWGARVALTPPDCPSGTARIASMLDKINGDWILNIQGDEPFVPPELLDGLVAASGTVHGDIITPVFPIHSAKKLEDINLVKVVRAGDGRAIYFSRAAVPHVRAKELAEWPQESLHWGHVGVYAYRRIVLENYGQLPASQLEQAEGLEQLRFLEAGIVIQTMATDYHPIGVDCEADLQRARQRVARQ